MADSVAELIARAEAAVDALLAVDVAGLPAEQGEALLGVLRRLADRSGAKRLEVLRAVRECGAWALDGSRSFAHHLMRTEGARLASVRAEIRVADRVCESLPGTKAAVLAGRLGLDHVRELARAADTAKRRAMLADPDCGEAMLLEQAAQLTADEFAVVVSAWRYRADPDAEDERFRRLRETQNLHLDRTLDGWAVKGWLSPDSGQLLRTALDAVRGRPPAGDTRAPSQRDADALVGMAREVLDAGRHGAAATVRPHLSVHVGFDTLQRLAEGRDMIGAEPARLDDGGPLPAWLLARIACDCELTRIVFGPRGEVLDVGRTYRRFTRAQRRGLIARDKHCVWSGCTAPPNRCEAHHLHEWNDGGLTDLDNGALVCWWHHDYLHQNNLQLRHRDGHWIVLRADGRERLRWPTRSAA